MYRWLKSMPLGVLARVALDLALVHISILAAVSVAVMYHLSQGHDIMAQSLAGAFPAYYWFIFCPLSLLFPVIFALNGIYSKTRTFRRPYKLLVIARGAAIASLVFLAANYFLFPGDLVARSIAVVFGIFSVAAVTCARLVKPWLLRYVGAETSAEMSHNHKPGTILVVGGAGYIGSHLVRRLLDSGHKVRALDNLVYGYGAIKGILRHPNMELVVGDCRNIQTVVSAVKDVHTIIHLAAIVGDPACELEKQTALETNYAATRMLIEVAKGNGVERFIFASSCSVYGAADTMMDEHSEVNPISLYAQTKVDSEEALLRAKSATFHPTILRFATVFGNSHRPRFDLVVNLLTARAFQEGTITIFNGEQWRPFIHVKDIAEGIISVLDAPVRLVSGEIYNVGDSSLNYTLSQVAEVIREEFPDTRVEFVENNDRRNYRVSFDKIRNQLGFQCTWDVPDGVRELKAAFASGEILDYTDAYYSNQKYLQTSGGPTHQDEMDERVMAAFSVKTHLAQSTAYAGRL